MNVEKLDHTKNYWEEKVFSVSSLITPSDKMMMRFIAKDEPDDSLCEACIDDFVIKTYSMQLGLDLVGTPKIGTTIKIVIDSPEDGGLGYLMLASLGTYPPILLRDRIFPLQYDFFLLYSLNPNNGIFFNFAGFLDTSGQSTAPAFVIPNLQSLVGVELFFAAVTLDSGYPDGIKNISAPLPVTLEK